MHHLLLPLPQLFKLSYSLFFLPLYVFVSVTGAKTMKQSLYQSALLLFLLFLCHFSKLSARPMASKQGQKEVNINDMTTEDSLVQKENYSELINLMGSEVCQSRDEECFERRILSEAHLDYIYTQHHKP